MEEYKGYLIVLRKEASSYQIKHTGKGSLPKSLSGLWSTVKMAKLQIDSYLDTKG